MKFLIIVVAILIIALQYRLWFGDGSLQQLSAYQQRMDDLTLQVNAKKERNAALYAEVLDLRKGKDAIEERARYDLGMIREGETLFQVIE